MVNSWWLVVLMIWVNSVKCKKCDLSDEVCTTRGTNRAYPTFIAGVENLVEPSDPLHIDLIEGELPGLKFVLRNLTLSGMKHCSVPKLKINKVNSIASVEYHVRCPQVVYTAFHEGKGKLFGTDVDAKGSLNVTCDDYLFKFDIITSNIEQNEYVKVESYKVDVEALGGVVYDFKNEQNDVDGKFQALQNFLNENWKDAHNFLHKPAIESLMSKYMDNVNAYLKIVPFAQIMSE